MTHRELETKLLKQRSKLELANEDKKAIEKAKLVTLAIESFPRLTQINIARILGVPKSTVSSWIQQSRKKRLGV